MGTSRPCTLLLCRNSVVICFVFFGSSFLPSLDATFKVQGVNHMWLSGSVNTINHLTEFCYDEGVEFYVTCQSYHEAFRATQEVMWRLYDADKKAVRDEVGITEGYQPLPKEPAHRSQVTMSLTKKHDDWLLKCYGYDSIDDGFFIIVYESTAVRFRMRRDDVCQVPGKAYLTGSINTTRPHTDYWYRIGDEICLECHFEYSEDSKFITRRVWWRTDDKIKHFDYIFNSTHDGQKNISTLLLSTSLQWYHNSSLLKCWYGEVNEKKAIVKETILMTVRLLLDTTWNQASTYTGISGTITTTAKYNEHRYYAGDTLHLVCHSLWSWKYLFSSQIYWSIVDKSCWDQTLVLLEKGSFPINKFDSTFNITLTEEHHLWTLQCMHRELSSHIKTIYPIEILMIRLLLKEEWKMQDRKWKNGVIGISSVAAVAFVCLVTYLSIKYLHKLKQREKTKVNSYESKGSASNKSSLDEEPVYEEVDSEQGTLNRKNDQVIYERMTSGSKTRAKQAVLDEDVEMTKTQKMSPYADGQSDSNYSNQIKNEIIEKETKTKKLGIKVSRHETRYTNK